MIRHRDRLTDLLDVHSHGSRDVVHVIRDRARVPHQRIDVSVNAIEHVAHFGVALSEIPCCGHQRHREHQQSDRGKTTGVRGHFLERGGFRLNLFRYDRVWQRRCRLKQPVRSRRQPFRHARVVCKGKAT